MSNIKKRALAVLVSICMASMLTLTACGGSSDGQSSNPIDDIAQSVTQLIEGDVTGEVGVEYETKWFTFSIDSMEIVSSYEEYTAAEGYLLVVAHITETNISGSTQPFGTFDWYIDDDSLTDYIYPLDPFDGNSTMMPESFNLADGETASYDVVIEYPADLASPFLIYTELDEEGTAYTTFKLPIK